MKGSSSPPKALVRELADLGYTLMRLLFQEAKEVFARYGLSPQKNHLLNLLAQGVNLPSRLAEHLEVQPSQVSHLLSAMEEEGLLERTPDPEDRRRTLLRLTPRGEALRREVEEAWLSAFARHLARLEEEEVLRFREILKKLTGVGHA
ncbi:MarR family transcriptional regulator [Thermus sp.]|uniref:MarR family winged helix-turn-helix transcriptional regulator n=1 Tax=Thermus sp. TaxID=275 RepID=UPI00307DCC69